MLISTTRNFDKKFAKQPKKIRMIFKNKIDLFMEDLYHPILKTHKLSGKLKNLWSFNLTRDIRVIFDQNNKEVVLLVDIGSHSELYS